MRRPRPRPPQPRPSTTRRAAAGSARSTTVVVVALAALIGAIGAGGCGGDTAAPPASSSTTAGSTPAATDPPATAAPTTTSTTAAPTGDEAEVRAVIDRYWDAWFIAAANPPDPANAELNAVLTGEAQMRIVGGIERRLNSGQFIRLPADTQYSRTITAVTFNEDGTATVDECVVDDAEIAEIATGATVEEGTATLRLTTTLNRFPPNGWKITTTTATEKLDGVVSCDG